MLDSPALQDVEDDIEPTRSMRGSSYSNLFTLFAKWFAEEAMWHMIEVRRKHAEHRRPVREPPVPKGLRAHPLGRHRPCGLDQIPSGHSWGDPIPSKRMAVG